MKLIEAVRIVAASQTGAGAGKRFYLATGITPLHLATFLHAHLRNAWPDDPIHLDTGVFGDVSGNISRAAAEGRYNGIAVAIEYSDLDPRLGLRICGGWTSDLFPDILSVVTAALGRIEESVRQAAAVCPVAISLPALPLPPVAWQPGWQAGDFELRLSAVISQAAVRLADISRVFLVNRARLDQLSPLNGRLDVKSDLAHGFPYRTAHADVLASLLASLLRAQESKKGLITDLDDTLWNGILGEVGVQGVCWDLSSHAQSHGLYQQFLHTLADAGILLAIASKNETALVTEALGRTDLLLAPDRVYPVEASWGAKSAAVSRILQAWNVGADSVVFVDDSPLEIEEVRAAHPGIECFLFPKNDPQAVWELLWTLRDRFGKSAIREEDKLRLNSLRSAGEFRESAASTAATPDEVLVKAAGKITLHISRDWKDERALELVNKTNQFNLNGIRYTPTEWQAALSRDNSFLMTVSYEDKFGPLGKIGILIGTYNAAGVRIEEWVLSCRAFSRRIEFQCLRSLYDYFTADRIELAFKATERNGPLREFLEIFIPDLSAELPGITRERFDALTPALPHKVELSDADFAGRHLMEVTHGS